MRASRSQSAGDQSIDWSGSTIRRPYTEWARARRLRGRRIRTCVRATVDGDDIQLRRGLEGNIVRGDDWDLPPVGHSGSGRAASFTEVAGYPALVARQSTARR